MGDRVYIALPFTESETNAFRKFRKDKHLRINEWIAAIVKDQLVEAGYLPREEVKA